MFQSLEVSALVNMLLNLVGLGLTVGLAIAVVRLHLRLTRQARRLDESTRDRAALHLQLADVRGQVGKLEMDQIEMRKQLVLQGEKLNRIITRLNRQNELLTELAPIVRELDGARIAEQVLAGLLVQRQAGTRVDIGTVRGDRDAHVGSTINRHEGD